MINNINNAYLVTLLLIGIGIVVKSLELIVISNTFKPAKQNNWDFVGIEYMQTGKLSVVFRNLFSRNGVIALCILSIFSLALSLFFINDKPAFALFILVTFCCQFFIHHRQEYGGDGADQMSFLILLTVVLCFIVTENAVVKKIGIIFIAAQLLLSYVISGGAKLISKEWRNGQAIQGILSSYTYGMRFTRIVFNKRPFLAVLIGWVVILIELLLPFSLLFNDTFFFCAIGFGILLHISIGIIMGLNDFIWSFTAAYPSLVFLYVNII